MKKIIFVIAIMTTMHTAFAQTIHDRGTTLKTRIDTGITNKSQTNKVRAVTEGELMKSVADYATRIFDSTQAALAQKVGNSALDTLFGPSDTTGLGTQYRIDTASKNVRQFVKAQNFAKGSDTNNYIVTPLKLNHLIDSIATALSPEIIAVANNIDHLTTTITHRETYVDIKAYNNPQFYPYGNFDFVVSAGNNIGDMLYVTGLNLFPSDTYEIKYYHAGLIVGLYNQVIPAYGSSTATFIWDGGGWILASSSIH